MEIGVWRVGGERALLQRGNLYVSAAHEGGKLSPSVLDAIAVKLQEGAPGGLRWCCGSDKVLPGQRLVARLTRNLTC